MKILKFKRENAYKAKRYSSVICLLSAIFSLGACKEKIDPQITNIKVSECKSHAKQEETEEFILEYIDGCLHVLHKNALAYCGATYADISFTVEKNTIVITEKPEDTYADCVCNIDISYTIGFIPNGEYTLIIKLGGKTIYNQTIIL